MVTWYNNRQKKDASRGLVGFCFQDVWLVNFMKTVQKLKEVKNEEIISGNDKQNN